MMSLADEARAKAIRADAWTPENQSEAAALLRALADLCDTYREALRHYQRYDTTCPCGARPRARQTHPHAMGCPVGVVAHLIENDAVLTPINDAILTPQNTTAARVALATGEQARVVEAEEDA